MNFFPIKDVTFTLTEKLFSLIRKISHIIVSIFLFFAFAGVTVNKHYCDGHIYSLKINHQSKKCCDNNNCGHCKDETIVIKVHNNFLPEFQLRLNSDQFPINLFWTKKAEFAESLVSVNSANLSSYNDISPPTTSVNISLLQNFLL